MPTYQYQCAQCGHEIEVSQKITAESLKECPNCHHEALKRGIGGGLTTFRFEGSGFYITDYASHKQESGERCPCGPSKSCSKA